MRYTLFKAMGISIGNSRVENDKLDVAQQILSKYKDKLVLPSDHMIINEFKDPAIIGFQYTTDENIPEGYEAIDIGPKGVELFTNHIANAKTIVRNGPVGVFEWETSAHGTKEVGKAIARNTTAYKLIGGGDSIAAVNSLGLTGFDHICTGGGAMLAYLGYDKFPTLDIILK
jgi:phosphoglycerate kinase